MVATPSLITPSLTTPHCFQPNSEEMKDASEEVMKLFSKSGSSSASSPEPIPDDVMGIRQELSQLKLSYSKANEVGGAWA